MNIYYAGGANSACKRAKRGGRATAIPPMVRLPATKGLGHFNKRSLSRGDVSFADRGNIAGAQMETTDAKVQTGISVVPGSLRAFLETQPGRQGGDRFLVVVDVEADRAVELVVAVPQGINPLIKLLRVRAALPISDSEVVRRTLRYEEAPAAGHYREVWLGEGDAAISAKVALVM